MQQHVHAGVLKSLSITDLNAPMYNYIQANLAKKKKPDACFFPVEKLESESAIVGFCATDTAVHA